MAIDIIKLNNNIRKLDAFINDITYRVEVDGLAVSQITSREQELATAEAYYGETVPEGAKPHSSKLKKTSDDKLIIIPPSVANYDKIETHLKNIKFPENQEIANKMIALKAWESKESVGDKNAAAEKAYNTYLAVLKMLSDGTMKNQKGQTPKAVATDGVKPGPYSKEVVTLEYMRILFNNPNNCIIPDAPVTAPAPSPGLVISSAAPTKRSTLNPIGVAIGGAVMQVVILLEAVLLDLMFSAPGSQHVVPFLLNMPGLAIIGGIIGAVSIAHGLMAHIQNKAPRPEGHALSITAGPCVPPKSPNEVLQEEADTPLPIFGCLQTRTYPPLGGTRREQVPTAFGTHWKGNPNSIN